MKTSIISPIIDSIKPKRGIGWVVFFSMLLFTACVALFAIGRLLSNTKLAYVPRVKLSGKLHLGSASFWGSVVAILGIGLFTVYFTIDNPDGGDKAFLWLISVPLILTALSLFVFQTTCNQLPQKIDILLKEAWKNKKIEPNQKIKFQDILVTKYDISSLMSEFEIYDVLKFNTDDEGNYIITTFHPIVERYFTENPPQLNTVNPTDNGWVCKGCGATNRLPTCEYCGNPKC